MAERQIIQHLRTNESNVKPSSSIIEYGEIAINYKKMKKNSLLKMIAMKLSNSEIKNI